MAQDLVLLLRPTIEVKDDPVLLDPEIGDQDAVARLRGSPLLDEVVVVVAIAIFQRAIRVEHKAGCSQRKRTRGKTLFRGEFGDELLPAGSIDRFLFKDDRSGLEHHHALRLLSTDYKDLCRY